MNKKVRDIGTDRENRCHHLVCAWCNIRKVRDRLRDSGSRTPRGGSKTGFAVNCHRTKPEKRPALIPPSLSRTPVPNFDRGNRCLYWMSRSPEDCTDRQRFCTRTGNVPPGPRTTSPFSGGNRNGGSRIRGERRIAPKARVAPRVRSRTEGGRSGTGDGVRWRKNSGFSPRFRQISAGFISRQE